MDPAGLFARTGLPGYDEGALGIEGPGYGQGNLSACVEALERELSMKPSPETQRLYEQIGHREWDGIKETPSQLADLVSLRPTFLDEGERYRVEKPIFVAREYELAQLERFLGQALCDQGRAVLITGEAGSGKTTLVSEFARRSQEAQADLTVASGNCNARIGIGDPYLPFREILELLTGDVETRWAAGAITGEHARRLWNMLPVVAHALVESGPDLIDTFLQETALYNRVVAVTPGDLDWLANLGELVKRNVAGSIV